MKGKQNSTPSSLPSSSSLSLSLILPLQQEDREMVAIFNGKLAVLEEHHTTSSAKETTEAPQTPSELQQHPPYSE